MSIPTHDPLLGFSNVLFPQETGYFIVETPCWYLFYIIYKWNLKHDG